MSVQTQISRITAAVGAAYDAVTAKGGTTPQAETVAGLADAIGTIPTGGPAPGAPGDITFYDYDGTIVTSWTLSELSTKTALPDYPSHEGLICQGWNWSLANLKTTNRKMNVGAMYITDDGKTRIYIRLEEGRTSPMLGVCPNGRVTVDWGDGTTPDKLTGTDTTVVKWTPNHAYAAPGEYVIKLTVYGTMGFYGEEAATGGSASLRYSSSADNRNYVYQNSVQKIEIGNGITSIAASAFYNCYSLASITIPDSLTNIGASAFYNCYSLASITIPDSLTNIGASAFNYCYSLVSITIPDGVTSIGTYAFNSCQSLASITIPNGVTSIGTYAFRGCNSLASITIPDGVTSVGDYAFRSCVSIASITIPDGVTSIGTYAFGFCYSLASITIPDSLTNIGDSAFRSCVSLAFYDFTACTTVPTLANTNAFTGIAADFQIRVPAALVNAWKTATNWSTYADHIVGV